MIRASGSFAASMLLASFLAASGAAHAASNANELVREGIRYENAEGFPRDYDRALALYCAAARMNDADAFLRMGWMYANARGQARDDQIANTLFRRAASLGNETAARLARMVRGEQSQDKLPGCLVPRASSAPSLDDGLTPVVDRPAEFGAMPAAARLALSRKVLELAREFQLDPRLVFAVLRTESNFDPLARSAKNAQGLMQLIPETAERFAVRNAFDPLENLRGGMRYLRWLLSYFKGDVVLALAGYNAGEGAVDRARGVPPYPETLAYVQRIRALYPHDHHPFDARVTEPSPWLQKQARQAALEVQQTTRPR
ncbi:MAG: transglycosylase SLT domain-containing protein [Burkholderiaceae bacterium]|nr:transglycosylase SLT domain-containing protein [Burkholderiaceae bacterium]